MGARMKRAGHQVTVLLLLVFITAFGLQASRAQNGSQLQSFPTALQIALKHQGARFTLLPDGRQLSIQGPMLVLVPSLFRTSRPAAVPQSIPLPQSRWFASATVLPDGRVLILGGVDARGRTIRQGLWFDPSNNNLTDATSVPLLPRAGHTATVLSDGRLLITGGWSSDLSSMPEAEVWDSRTNHSEVIPSLLEPPRIGHTATLLSDGRVLLRDGFDVDGRRLFGASVFNPATQEFSKADASGLIAPIDGMSIPKLAASIPAANVNDFPAGGLIALRFSEPMDMHTLTAQTITLLGPGGNTPVKVVGAEDGRLVFVAPATDLFPGAHYTLFVQDVMSQRHMGLPFTAIDFSVAAQNVAVVGATSVSALAKPNPISGRAVVNSKAPASISLATTGASSSTPIALQLMTGSDNHGTFPPTSCGAKNGDLQRLCRAMSYMERGTWYPGQDVAGDQLGGHWRLNKSDITPQEIAYAALMKNVPTGTGQTGISGRIELIDGSPIANVDVSIGTIHVRTDVRGDFKLVGAPAGRQTLYVDGTSANSPGNEYGQFVVSVTLKRGRVMPLSYRMYLPRILDRDKISIPSPTTQDLVITHPDVPGLEIHIPAGTVIKDYKGKIVTQIAIVPTPDDRAPFPLPENFSVFVSLQPGGATIQNLNAKAAQGIQVFYPNYQHLKPGTQTGFYIYDLADGWNLYGKNYVTADGEHIAPDQGVFVHSVMPFGGGISAPPSGHPGDGPQGRGCGGQTTPCTSDPVDLWSDTLEESQTDIHIDDIVPLDLTREFHATSLSGETRAFGGWRSNYDMYVYSPDNTWTNVGIRLPNGNLLAFIPIATPPYDNQNSDRAWSYAGSPTKWYGAMLEALTYEDPRCHQDASCYLLTLRDGTQYQFAGEGVEPFGALSRIQDRFGNSLTFTYSAGLLQQITSPSGRYVSFTYNSDNNIATATDNTGRTWTYNYTKHVQSNPAVTWYSLDSVVYPDATSWQFAYQTDWNAGSLGTLSTMTDRNGHQVLSNTYTQVPGGQTGTYTTYYVVSQALADGKTYIYTRTPMGSGTQEADVADPNGDMRKVVMDNTSGYPISDTWAAGTPQERTTTYTLDSSGIVQSKTDALGRETTYTYDADGNVTSATRLAGTPNAVTEEFTWTPDFGQIASYRDGLGHTTYFGYTNGCLTQIEAPLAHTTSIICSVTGQPLSITDALGHARHFAYQAYDLHSVSDALNRTTIYTTDALGRVVAISDPLAVTVRREYDTDGRVARLVDSMNNATAINYDAMGNVKSISLPNTGLIQYTYDERDRLKTRTDALNQSESWTYDGMGDVLSHTDRKNQLTTYQYDALDRRILTNFADGSTVTSQYDAGDRVTSLMDSINGNQTFTWDGLDRLTQAISPQGTVSYTYDAAGRRQTMTPGSQGQITYSYDDADRLIGIQQVSESVSLAYDNANRRSTLTLPNGVTIAYSYDDANELTGIAYAQSNGTSLGTLAYTYDSAGRRTSQTGTLASDTLPMATTQNSTFDLNDRQTGSNGATLTYDADGNLTSDGTNQYVWDARNQLVQVKQGALSLAGYTYDALGRRQTKSINGATPTSFLYDGINPVQETQGSTITPILTGLGVDEFYARTEPTGRDYFLTDAQSNTIGLTDTSGNLVERYQYDPYGGVTVQNAGFTNPYQYTGRENDFDGLYYHRARYYSPSLERFIAEDSFAFYGGQLNFYTYVNQAPVDHSDRSGNGPASPPEVGNKALNDAWQNAPDNLLDLFRSPSQNTYCVKAICTRLDCKGDIIVTQIITEWVPRFPTPNEVHKIRPDCQCIDTHSARE